MEQLPAQIVSVIEYLKEHLPEESAIVLFGSRARGTARHNADFDIGIFSMTRFRWQDFAVWKAAAEDIAWPYIIDLTDLTRAPDSFLEEINQEVLVLHGVWHGNRRESTTA